MIIEGLLVKSVWWKCNIIYEAQMILRKHTHPYAMKITVWELPFDHVKITVWLGKTSQNFTKLSDCGKLSGDASADRIIIHF